MKSFMQHALSKISLTTGLAAIVIGCSSTPPNSPTASNSPLPPPPPTPAPPPTQAVPNSIPPTQPAESPSASPVPSPESPTSETNPPENGTRNPKKIEFQSGSTSTEVQGKIASKTIARYVFTASAGQSASITIESPNQDIFLTLIDPQGSPIQRYQSGSASWSGKLTENGTYTIDAFATGNSSNYTLKITIQPLS